MRPYLENISLPKSAKEKKTKNPPSDSKFHFLYNKRILAN